MHPFREVQGQPDFYRPQSKGENTFGSICLSVRPSVWVCVTYVVHHLVGTRLHCALATCVVQHWAALWTMSFCSDIHFGSAQLSFVPIRWCKMIAHIRYQFFYGVQCSVVSLSVRPSVSALTITHGIQFKISVCLSVLKKRLQSRAACSCWGLLIGWVFFRDPLKEFLVGALLNQFVLGSVW